MNKYQNGKIYKIISKNTDDVYIGSTIQTLRRRLMKHEREYRKQRYYSSQKILEKGEYEIVLIKNFPCNSRLELCREEGKYQRSIENCINNNINRSKKEYREDNKEELKKKKNNIALIIERVSNNRENNIALIIKINLKRNIIKNLIVNAVVNIHTITNQGI